MSDYQECYVGLLGEVTHWGELKEGEGAHPGRLFQQRIFSCVGQRENSFEHILGTEKRLLVLELEERRKVILKAGDLAGAL